MSSNEASPGNNFIRTLVDGDLAEGRNGGRLVTRFPPEPNGYLHVGHAKSICLNFGLAETHAGAACYLRFDDTNPLTEDEEYAEAIREDVRWLGFDWGERVRYASDYFQRLYECAFELIRREKAYVCDLSPDRIRESRGTLTEPGTESPYRNRGVRENLDLFTRMKNGEFPDGSRVLRAKIDMASPNLNLRDPTLYRIRRASHYRALDAWCIYPLYDFTHPISDALECVTHSLCTLEFEDHRPLYDWVLDNLDLPCRPRQVEFSRLSLEYTVLSKRLLTQLVEKGHVMGWDDPRMPTLSGLRRRGYTPRAIRDFADRVGITKKEHVIEMGLLEYCLRDDLAEHCQRRMAVLNPLRVVIVDYPADRTEMLEAPNHPQYPDRGVRQIPFSRELYIERDDFLEDPPKRFFRLAPGREVRLRFAYYVTCTEVVKDVDTGEITEIRCRYDPATRGGSSPDGRKVKGTLHWVSKADAVKAEVRLYDRLFTAPNPGRETGDFQDDVNPDSLKVLTDCYLEPALAEVVPGTTFQFERIGYFCADRKDCAPGHPVFNRTVALRDSWARVDKETR